MQTTTTSCSKRVASCFKKVSKVQTNTHLEKPTTSTFPRQRNYPKQNSDKTEACKNKQVKETTEKVLEQQKI
jgi:hypothetical protein